MTNTVLLEATAIAAIVVVLLRHYHYLCLTMSPPPVTEAKVVIRTSTTVLPETLLSSQDETWQTVTSFHLAWGNDRITTIHSILTFMRPIFFMGEFSSIRSDQSAR